jgi:adenylate cyclase
MACAGCGSEVSAGFAFCPRCGRRQPVACAACGAPCEPDFAFCPRCGTARVAPGETPPTEALGAPPAALAGSTPRTGVARRDPTRDADRRQVTVLFADVSGFTTLSERLDPEDVRAFQNALFAAMAKAITPYDGFVEKFVGDAVLAVFGAPVAHEDDPERALRAALDMQAGASELSADWAGKLGQAVKLHIGIHTGPVVAGNLGDATAAAYAVTGDTVNTTARLLAAASGSMLVSDATYALTKHRFAFVEPRELRLRGKAEPVLVHRLVGRLDEPRTARGLAAHGLTTAMVGRGDDLDQLLDAFERMQRGRAQVVSVVGEAGTGKTRLIEAFLARLEADGQLERVALRRAACSSLGQPTYGIFANIFREGYDVRAEDSLEAVRQKLATGLNALGAKPEVAEAITPVLRYVLGLDETGAEGLQPEQLKRQIALAARTLVERRLQQLPVLFVVEDLHWADAASLDLLRDLADYLADRRLMMLVTHRPEIQPPLLARAAQSIIRLAPLSVEETRALVGGLFGPVTGSAFSQLQDFVVARAGGNPLFVEEIVRGLLGRGLLVREAEGWVCTAACDTVDVPATLQGLLLSRIDRLASDVRRMLQEAAVLGAVFEEQDLRAIAENGSVDVALEHLIEADLIRHTGRGRDGNRYRFTHALLHEVVYQNLLLSRRTDLHERAGRARELIVGPHPQRLSDLEALGHHWSLSADKRKGADYLVAAGDWARGVYANEDAIRHYERALGTLSGCLDCSRQAAAVRERLADLMALAGRRPEALAHYEAARQEYEIQLDAAGAARLHRKIGGLYWEAGDRERARACFDRGLEQLGEDGDAIERAQLFQEVGRLAFRTGDNASAIAWAKQALAEAEKGPDAVASSERAKETTVTRAQAYNTLGVALARTGQLQEAVEQIERSVALADTHDLQATCRAYANLGVLYSSLNPQRSIETCLKGLETAKKVGDLGFQSRLYANLAVAYCSLTDRCEAEGLEAAQKAIDLDRRLGLLDHLAVPLIVLGQIYQCHGEHTQALACYQEALGHAEKVGEPQLLFPCYDGLATIYLDVGDQVRAEVYLARSQEVCARAGVDPDALTILPFLC